MFRSHKFDLDQSKVIETRISKDGKQIRRRRECLRTGQRFTTLEDVLREDLYVIKSDGRREEFSRDKMIHGIRKATEKRPIQAEQIEMLVNEVLEQIDREHDAEVPSKVIGEAIMNGLKHMDHIAYVRFASVYKEFRDIEALDAEIRALREDVARDRSGA